jgi:hypothetical protein
VDGRAAHVQDWIMLVTLGFSPFGGSGSSSGGGFLQLIRDQVAGHVAALAAPAALPPVAAALSPPPAATVAISAPVPSPAAAASTGGGCSYPLVPYEGQCLCPAGYFPDPRPGFQGVCVPHQKSGGIFNVEGPSLAVSGRTDLLPGSLVPPGLAPTSAPSPGTSGGAAFVTPPTSAAALSATLTQPRTLVWLGIGGVGVLALVLLLRR